MRKKKHVRDVSPDHGNSHEDELDEGHLSSPGEMVLFLVVLAVLFFVGLARWMS